MRWKQGRRSTNVEDRRGSRAPRVAGTAGVGVIVVALIAMFLGVDPTTVLNLDSSSVDSPVSLPGGSGNSAAADEMSDFISVVLGDTEDTWQELFRQMGRRYREPKLVIFTGAVKSACGMAESAMGPFYCPADEKVYIDLAFYDDLRSRFRAPGDFAQAYVIAHEVGHHVQNLLGITDQIHSMRGQVSQTEYNRMSVRLELQADFFAGVWAHHAQKARKILESGDIEEALGAASAIGDDRLQRQSRGYVTPDSFTHGTSEQRARWFRRGLETGDVRQGDTFNASRL